MYSTLQRSFELCIPRNKTARPYSQFPYSDICERFMYSQDRSTFFCCSQIDRPMVGIYTIAHIYMNVETGTEAAQQFPFWDIFFQFSVWYLCCERVPICLSFKIGMLHPQFLSTCRICIKLGGGGWGGGVRGVFLYIFF
jgi:hypothetical protein